MLFFFFVIIPGCFNLLSFFFFFVSCFHILPKATITETKQNKAKEEGEIVRSDVHGQESRALLLCFLPAVFGPLFAELRKNKNNNNNNNNSNSTFSALQKRERERKTRQIAQGISIRGKKKTCSFRFRVSLSWLLSLSLSNPLFYSLPFFFLLYFYMHSCFCFQRKTPSSFF